MKKIIYILSIILIFNSCKKDLVADFEITGVTKVGETVSFINHSGSSTTYSWNFGDGTTSTDENPVHIYSKPATYTVTLKISGGSGSASANKPLKITGTTYSFKNNTSFDLSDFRSFYFTGTEIADIIVHGALPQGQETRYVISTRPEVEFGFRYIDVYYIGTRTYPLIPDTHNMFIIDDNTPVVSGKGANVTIGNLKVKRLQLQK